MTNLLISIPNNLYEYIVKGAELSRSGWKALYEAVQHGNDTYTCDALNAEIERLANTLSDTEAKCKELEEENKRLNECVINAEAENKRLNECIDNAKAEIGDLATDGDNTSSDLLKLGLPYKAGQRAAYNHALSIIITNLL